MPWPPYSVTCMVATRRRSALLAGRTESRDWGRQGAEDGFTEGEATSSGRE